MWHHFLALPLVARIIGLLGVGGLAIYGWLKRKAIATAGGAIGSAVSDRFYGHLRKKLKVESATPAPANLRTYRGTFEGCHQYTNYPHEAFFDLADGGVRVILVQKRGGIVRLIVVLMVLASATASIVSAQDDPDRAIQSKMDAVTGITMRIFFCISLWKTWKQRFGLCRCFSPMDALSHCGHYSC